MNTIVLFILGWASFASADSSIGGYSYETPSYETPWLDQNSGWHPPQQVDRSSQLANLLRTNARQAVTDPSVLVGVVGAGMNAVYTATATAAVANTVTSANKRIDGSNKRIDASNKRISTVETRSSSTCSKLSALVGITAPTVSYLACTASSCAPPATARSSSGIYNTCATTTPSKGTSDCVATNLLDSYILAHGLTTSSSTGTIPASTSTGLGAIAVKALTSSGTSFSMDKTALSLTDFNNFRKKVAEAINTLDKKIEDILKITAPSC